VWGAPHEKEAKVPFSEERADELARLIDDLQIRRVVTDYAALIDAREWDRLRDVFDPDVEVNYHNGRTVVRGAETVVDYVRTNTAHLAWQHHMVSPYAIDIDGDSATGLVYLVSHQQLSDDTSHVLSMAAKYAVTLTRRPEGWCLSGLVHTIDIATFLPVTTSPPGGSAVPPPVRH
jgi:hypothetical protein